MHKNAQYIYTAYITNIYKSQTEAQIRSERGREKLNSTVSPCLLTENSMEGGGSDDFLKLPPIWSAQSPKITQASAKWWLIHTLNEHGKRSLIKRMLSFFFPWKQGLATWGSFFPHHYVIIRMDCGDSFPQKYEAGKNMLKCKTRRMRHLKEHSTFFIIRLILLVPNI